jgi:hypothetical protein
MQPNSTTAVLLLLAWVAGTATVPVRAAIEGEFVASNAELASLVPTRLVFSDSDLANCLADKFASRCVLRAPIKLDEPTWRTQLAKTNGVAVLTKEQSPVTITSGAITSPSTACPGPKLGTYSMLRSSTVKMLCHINVPQCAQSALDLPGTQTLAFDCRASQCAANAEYNAVCAAARQ